MAESTIKVRSSDFPNLGTIPFALHLSFNIYHSRAPCRLLPSFHSSGKRIFRLLILRRSVAKRYSTTGMVRRHYSSLKRNGNCSSILIPPSINTIISIASFTESSGTAFCVLYESSVESGHYTKGWSLFAVHELRADVSRSIYFSALARWRWGHPTTSSFLVQGDRREEPAHHWEEVDGFSIVF